jgi:hypothetical protein
MILIQFREFRIPLKGLITAKLLTHLITVFVLMV